MKDYYFVYVLKSLKDKKHYIGQTSRLISRYIRHQRGNEKSTQNRRPLQLIHFEIVSSRKEAMKREKQLKKFKGGEAFKKILNSG